MGTSHLGYSWLINNCHNMLLSCHNNTPPPVPHKTHLLSCLMPFGFVKTCTTHPLDSTCADNITQHTTSNQKHTRHNHHSTPNQPSATAKHALAHGTITELAALVYLLCCKATQQNRLSMPCNLTHLVRKMTDQVGANPATLHRQLHHTPSNNTKGQLHNSTTTTTAHKDSLGGTLKSEMELTTCQTCSCSLASTP